MPSPAETEVASDNQMHQNHDALRIQGNSQRFINVDNEERIRAEIESIFSGTISQRHQMDRFVLEMLPSCNNQNVADFLRLAGKKSNSSPNHTFLKNHLPAIADRIVASSAVSWKLSQISFIIYGQQALSENDVGLLKILSTMTIACREVLKGCEIIKPRTVSLLLLGLQNNQCICKESKDFLIVVAEMIKKVKITFGSQAISNCLYSLQNMNSDNYEVRTVLAALLPHIKNMTEEFSSQGVGNALYGLNKMDVNRPEVLQTINLLIPKIRECKERISPQAVSNALYGLRRMTSEKQEVRTMINVLAVHTENCNGMFNAQT